MSKQLIITISREYGSGGHIIATDISKRLNLPMYDSNLLSQITKEKSLDFDELKKYDEAPKNRLFSRTIKGFSNSPEENIAHLQFEYLRDKAKTGESFVVLGRCGATVLNQYDIISIFLIADMDTKIERITKLYNISVPEAKILIQQQNKARKSYHNNFCTVKWGDSRNYDLSINCSRLGFERTADLIEHYIKERIK